jgi:ABC-type sulfate transport system permease subunit
MKIFKSVALFALAIVAVPIGFVYGIAVAIAHVMTYPRTAGRELYEAFRQLSKIVSVMAAELLNAVLIQEHGIPFGTHSVSATLGANYRERTLQPLGEWLRATLDSIEARHCTTAAERAGI